MAKHCNSSRAESCRAHLSPAPARICVKKAVAGISSAAQSAGTQNSKGLCEKQSEPHSPQPCSSSPSHILSSLNEKLCSPEINNTCEFKGSKWNYFSYSSQNLTQMSSEVRSLLSHHLFQD